MSNQRPFGDRARNYTGNNGYGYEEHEQYINNSDTKDTKQPISLSGEDDKVIAIQAGWDYDKVDNEADFCHMTKLGTAFFDDGEEMTDEHIVEQTVHYYANTMPNQTAVFLNRVQASVPDATITTQAEYSDDLGDDVSRFLPDVNMAQLDFEGLDDGLER